MSFRPFSASGNSVDALQRGVLDVEEGLRSLVKKQPVVAVVGAAGLGYVLGGGLRSRLTAVLFGMGARLAAAVVVRELSAALIPPTTLGNQPTVSLKGDSK